MDGVVNDSEEFYRLVYFGGCEHDIRKEVWPFLLGHYSFGSTAEERAQLDETSRHYFETTMSEWLAVEAIVRQRDKEKTANAVAKLSSESGNDQKVKQTTDADNEIENDVFEENGFSDLSDPEEYDKEKVNNDDKTSKVVQEVPIEKPSRMNKSSTDSGNVADADNDAGECKEVAESEKMEKNEAKSERLPSLTLDKEADEYKLAVEDASNKSSPSSSSYETVANDFVDLIAQIEEIDEMNIATTTTNQPHSTAVIVTDASIDIANVPKFEKKDADDVNRNECILSSLREEIPSQPSLDALQEPKSACVSPASSNGGIYSVRY